jgi:hypothetical protein
MKLQGWTSCHCVSVRVKLATRCRGARPRYRKLHSRHLTSLRPYITCFSMVEHSSRLPVSQGESTDYIFSAFEKIQELLRTKDDTSRFVGLALLKPILDNEQLAQNPERLRTLWESISPKFIDRLLRARPSDKVTNLEAQNMVDLAVSVLHTFTALLPEECQKDNRIVGRASHLVKALVGRLVFNTLSKL